MYVYIINTFILSKGIVPKSMKKAKVNTVQYYVTLLHLQEYEGYPCNCDSQEFLKIWLKTPVHKHWIMKT